MIKRFVSFAVIAGFAIGAAACGSDEKKKTGAEDRKTTVAKDPKGHELPPDQPNVNSQVAPAPRAIARLIATSGSKVGGKVVFVDTGAGNDGPGVVEVTVTVTGLEPGEHGFYIYKNGGCSAADGASASGQFNPTGTAPDGAAAAGFQLGDLGNLIAEKDGRASKQFIIPGALIGAGGDDHSLLERPLIIYARSDDAKSPPGGAAGVRVACGVIEELPMLSDEWPPPIAGR